MASVSYQIGNLLEKMTSSDKDFRFMATNDLMSELQKDSIKLDDDSEKKVVKMLLRLLEDKNGEVQNLAVKCLGPLVNKVKDHQVETIVDALCTNMVSEKEQLRDISSIGLKTVINELPVTSTVLAANVCKRITGRLSSAIEKDEDVPVQLEALDILSDLLSRFGPLMVSFHGTLLRSLLPQLSSARQAVRKRTIVALSLLVMSCNNVLYSKLIDVLLEGLSVNASTRNMRTYVQCIASVCRQAGHRFGEHIERVMPIIKQYSCTNDDEVREYCLQALEAFIQRCPKESTPHIADIVNLCLSYVTYDPNYNYDDDGQDGDNGNMETEETDDDGDDEYSDDDDMSWKVRRSAAKCLEAIITTRHELLLDFYRTVSPKLISRFKEREENVKSDIFHTYVALLKATRPSVGLAVDPDGMEQEGGPVSMLQMQVPDIVKAIQFLMQEKSIKARQDCFLLLKELVTVLPGALNNHIPAIIPGIQFSLGDKYSSSNMKIDTLGFTHCLLTSHTCEVFHPFMPVLAPLVITAVGDSFYKIIAEGLLVMQQLVKVIRPLDPVSTFDYRPYIDPIYQCTLMRLKATDIDQEVKERAVSCMGQVISSLGDNLQAELAVCLPILLDRLRNEITRLHTVIALNTISASPLHVDLGSVLYDAVPLLGSFLRKTQRNLKLSTLALLDSLVLRDYGPGVGIDNQLLSQVLVEVPGLLKASDLHIAQMTLTLLSSIAHMYPASLADNVAQDILPDILELAKSPLLQGAAMKAMLAFFKALVSAGLPGLGYRELLAMLVLPVTHVQSTRVALHKQAFHSLASCVAVLTLCCYKEVVPVVEQFLQDLQNPASDVQHIFALLVIGEIGRHADLSSIPDLKHTVLNSLSSPSEEIKTSASYALGLIALGNLPTYLPFLLREIAGQPRRQYLLLNSLKEIIAWQSATPHDIQQLQPFVLDIWRQLFRHCECAEEGTRNVVAECLGKLALIDPGQLLPLLQETLLSPSALMRTTVITAVKFTITNKPQPIDPILRQCIGHFLSALQDPDLGVRHMALVAFNSAAHNKPALVRDLLDTVLPTLYAETNVRKELIREVEMGPFHHTVDDGLDVRKAAFECMYTLLDTCLDRIDIFLFLNHVENGLRDHSDIKMLTYLMVERLAKLAPSAILQRLDRLIDPLRLTCTMKLKANLVKQEYEKQDELKRLMMRAVDAILSISSADKNPHLCEFVSQIKATPELAVMFDAIQKDLNTSSQDAAVSMDRS